MLQVSQLFIYPIKSLGGISLKKAETTERGFRYDRRWLLINSDNEFMTQREFPQMCLLQPFVSEAGIVISHKQNKSEFFIPFESQDADEIVVKIWNDYCRARLISESADEWFSEMLSVRCKIVFMPEDSRRPVDRTYAKHEEITSFSDAFPFLLIGQSSLDDLNKKLETPVPINRFRPNIVFTGGAPYEEDFMKAFKIGDVNFYGVKPCARCPIPTVNQENAFKTKEPINTLAKYRSQNNKVFFGQNLLHMGQGTIHVGDEITVTEKSSVVIYP
jgi:uncharacterized protein